jgi:hypothetical protein
MPCGAQLRDADPSGPRAALRLKAYTRVHNVYASMSAARGRLPSGHPVEALRPTEG